MGNEEILALLTNKTALCYSHTHKYLICGGKRDFHVEVSEWREGSDRARRHEDRGWEKREGAWSEASRDRRPWCEWNDSISSTITASSQYSLLNLCPMNDWQTFGSVKWMWKWLFPPSTVSLIGSCSMRPGSMKMSCWRHAQCQQMPLTTDK